MLLRAGWFSAPHGFSTRRGGVSEGRYASLNLSYKWGDKKEHVDENRRRFAHEGGFAVEDLVTCKQVHGNRVVRVGDDRAAIATTEADGLVTDRPVVLAVGTADCVPILLADNRGRVAALHAGWRGTVANIAKAGVDALVELGADRNFIMAVLGPCICVKCFEVGDDVAAQFPSDCVDRSFPKPHVDLRLANRKLLEAAGVRSIDSDPPCTMHEPERYFSYRRDGGEIGQHLSFVVGGQR